jgi:flagellar hook-length control protein FliK
MDQVKPEVSQSNQKWDGEFEHSVKLVGESSNNGLEFRAMEAAARPSTLQEAVNNVRPESPVSSRMATPEPLRFSVNLPDMGVRLSEISSFKVSIQPEDLGHVRVNLSMCDDRLVARLTVQSPAAGQAVEANLPALRDALLQNGIRVEHFTVNVANGDAEDRGRNSRKDNPPEFTRGKGGRPQSTQAFEMPVRTTGAAPMSSRSGVVNLVA